MKSKKNVGFIITVNLIFKLYNKQLKSLRLIPIDFSQNGPVVNPAFTRIHPTRNVIYSCTESVEDNGEVIAWKLCHETGKLSFLSAANAHGTSTCYITIDKV